MDDRDFNLTKPAPAAPAAVSFSSWRAFTRHWRESMRYYGWWRSLRATASAICDALLELLPSRRKARFGDLDYDWEHSVDTTRSSVGAGTQFLTGLVARPYFATEPWLFRQIMEALALSIQQSAVSQGLAQGALRDFTFIDLGCGRGRVLLMASDYPFKGIIGVEFMPNLVSTAEKNIASYSSDEAVCTDARDFQFPAEPLVVYLFNPFSESTFAQVLENLHRSVEQMPRPVYIAYRFTEFEGLLTQAVWLEKAAGEEQWAVYGYRRDLVSPVR
jgi:SAM-dependent methyltransferase